MAIHDEVARLADLHKSGALTDAEFAAAKAKIIAGDQETLGQAANKAIKLSTIWGAISLALILAFFFFFFLPQWNRMGSEMQSSQEKFDKQFQQSREQFEKSFNQGQSQSTTGQGLGQTQ